MLDLATKPNPSMNYPKELNAGMYCTGVLVYVRGGEGGREGREERSRSTSSSSIWASLARCFLLQLSVLLIGTFTTYARI